MDISNRERLVKLVTSLVRHPDHFLPYLRTSIFGKGSPADYEMPWWSFSAIEKADTLFPGKRIFEWGTGGSTVRYAKVAQHITSVEDDAGWLTDMDRRLSEGGLKSKVTLNHHAFDFRNPVNFESSDYILALDKSYDVIVIDGQDWTFKERLPCFARAESFIQEGGLMFLMTFGVTKNFYGVIRRRRLKCLNLLAHAE